MLEMDFSQSECEFLKDEDGFVNVKVEPDPETILALTKQLSAEAGNFFLIKSDGSEKNTSDVPKPKKRSTKKKPKSFPIDSNPDDDNDGFEDENAEKKKAGGRLCVDCGKWLSSRKTLSAHRVALHKNVFKTYTCPYCKEEIVTKHYAKFYKHKDICEAAFTGKTDKHVCQKCGAKFPTLGVYTKHRIKCFNIKPKKQEIPWRGHVCTFEGCNYANAKKGRLENHIRQVHLNLPRIGHACEICGKEYAEKRYLEIHISEQHVNPDYRPFQCSQCNSSFKNKTMLSEHVKIHSDVLSYLCSFCGKGFKQKAVLYRHKLNCQAKP